MKYTNSHEWALLQDKIATVGISDHAQKELGEIVYIEFPKIGDMLSKEDVACVLESTKAAVDISTPLTGKVTEINTSLKEAPSIVNQKAEAEGWLYKLEIDNPQEYKTLLSQEDYQGLFK